MDYCVDTYQYLGTQSALPVESALDQYGALNKLVSIVGGGQGPIAEDNFKPSAQIFDLCALCWRNSNADVAVTCIGIAVWHNVMPIQRAVVS
ncbi:hypothetical protein HFD88_001669 [Aspergillus terreus]|nr:hypothetical protein HFD88_001669 [Aspergillus terreus]